MKLIFLIITVAVVNADYPYPAPIIPAVTYGVPAQANSQPIVYSHVIPAEQQKIVIPIIQKPQIEIIQPASYGNAIPIPITNQQITGKITSQPISFSYDYAIPAAPKISAPIPQENYGTPKPIVIQETYGPPQVSQETYGPPQTEASSPVSFSYEYGIPVASAKPKPQEIYGTPIFEANQPIIVQETYGSPQTEISPPVSFSYEYAIPAAQIKPKPQETNGTPIFEADKPIIVQETYGPPEPIKPQETYGPPQTEISPPVSFSYEYAIPAAPIKPKPQETYGTPIFEADKPIIVQETYGPPQPIKPQEIYGPPHTETSPPVSFSYEYAIPAAPIKPKPQETYGTPIFEADKPIAVQETYGSPKPSEPQETYGPPQPIAVQPVIFSYDYSIPETPKTPQNIYSTPSNEAYYPIVPHPTYGVPKSESYEEHSIPTNKFFASAPPIAAPIVYTGQQFVNNQQIFASPSIKFPRPYAYSFSYSVPETAEIAAPITTYDTPTIENPKPTFYSYDYSIPSIPYESIEDRINIPVPVAEFFDVPKIKTIPNKKIEVVVPHSVYGPPVK